MNHEIYAALSGALANDRRQEITANNLANINSGGFRRDVPLFKTVYDRVSGNNRPLAGAEEIQEHNAFVVHDGNWIDFQTGAMQDTANPLDAALDGEGFFALKRVSDGTTYYTRDGHFRINKEQELVAINGDQVLAAGASDVPLVLAGENPGPAQNIKIGKLGDVLVDGQPVGALRLVTFTNLQGLQKSGDSGFLETPASGPPEVADQVIVSQGVRELANVNVMEEMVSLIEIARQYQAQQKVITGIDELNSKAAKGIVA